MSPTMTKRNKAGLHPLVKVNRKTRNEHFSLSLLIDELSLKSWSVCSSEIVLIDSAPRVTLQKTL